MEFSKIIDLKNSCDNKKCFELLVLGAFNAHNDLVNIFKLMNNEDCSANIMLTLFKQHIGIIKESASLLTRLFDNYKAELEELDNFEIISTLYNEFKLLYDDNTYSRYLKIRNYAFHYSKTDKDEDLKALINETPDFEVGFILDKPNNAHKEYSFVSEVYARYYSFILSDKQDATFLDCFSENVVDSSRIGALALKILDKILLGYTKKKGLI